ncbi:hypothetical protein OIU84_003267 [Salix udensis]|uniref:Nucleoporin autopeptidase n=1 Tax=Salix udensis TaxID=889485 RepID=A0AAD6P693_9ROSI|nr:hypothetical protein OIU84_003267 [Salix udensis]
MQVIILLRQSHLVVRQILLVPKQEVLYLGALQLVCLAHPKLLHYLQRLLLERLVPLFLVLRHHQHLVVLLFSVRSLWEALGLQLKRVLLEAQISSHSQLLGIVYLVPHLSVHQLSLHLARQVLQPLARQVLQPLVRLPQPLVPQALLKPLVPQAPLQPLALQTVLQPLAPQALPQPLAQPRLQVLVAQELHLPVPSLFGTGGAFGTSTTSGFGASTTTPAFGNSTISAFGTPTTSAFGATSSPSFTFSSSPGFGQSTSAFGSSPFGSTTSTFPAQTSPFGAQNTTSPFGNTGFAQSGFGGQRPGSRASPYAETAEAEGGAQAGKLLSISAMTAYKDKSHEELRWEDYQLGDKGGPLPAGQSPGGGGFNVSAPQPNPFAPPTGLGQTSSNIFSSTTSNLFAPKTQTSTPSFNTTSFGPSTSSNLFQSSTTPAFSAGSSPSLFGSSSTPSFSSTPSLFSSTVGQGTVSPFGSSMFNNTQPSLSFPSTTPSLGQTNAFSQPSPFGPSTTSSLFSSPSTGGLFSSTPSLSTPNLGGFNQMTPSQPAPFQMSQTAQNAGAFALNFSQTQAAGMSGFAGVSNNLGQLSTTQSAAAIQPVPVTNPFGTLPAMPQMSIGRAGTTPSVQYGISSMPVIEKPSPVRVSSLLTSRHLSQRRIRLPARKYYPKHDGPKVPFFSDEEETPSTPKADALFIPRENPRALVIRPMDQWPSRASAEKASPVNASAPVHENGKKSESDHANLSNGSTAGDKNKNLAENGVIKEQAPHVKVNQKPDGVHEDHSAQKEESYMTLSGHRAGEAAIVYEHGADIEALMPKLRRSDYFTEPRIQELAAKERAKPGFCRHVKDFVVGRQGYGSIKFLGETDVRRLDLESLVQFNNREVIVYMDDSKKPPVGQGLNKPAEVTLLNIKCFDKKTGRQFTEGPKIERYKEMLKRKAEDQGAEFVSYDPAKGEWKFKVNHFSKYMLEEEEEEDDDWEAQATEDC